jgi:hypothetical protein
VTSESLDRDLVVVTPQSILRQSGVTLDDSLKAL